jgi:hypothetical protein
MGSDEVDILIHFLDFGLSACASSQCRQAESPLNFLSTATASESEIGRTMGRCQRHSKSMCINISIPSREYDHLRSTSSCPEGKNDLCICVSRRSDLPCRHSFLHDAKKRTIVNRFFSPCPQESTYDVEQDSLRRIVPPAASFLISFNEQYSRS